MKKELLFFLVFSYGLSTCGQYLTQSADGKGSIPLPLSGIGLGLDIGKSEITFGLNNYDKVLNNRDNKKNWFTGLNLSVKNSDGIGNLFSSGDITPAGDFLGFLGYTFSNNDVLLSKWNSSDFVKNKQADLIRAQLMFDAYKKDVLTDLGLSIGKIINDPVRSNIEQELITRITASGDKREIDHKIGEIKTMHPEVALKDFWSQLDELVTGAKRKYIETFNTAFTKEAAKAEADAFAAALKDLNPWRITPFLQGGINARNFTIFTGVNAAGLSNSFKDTLFRGGTIGLGLNVQYRNFWFGATYSYLDGDNFVNLSTKDYTLSTRDTVGNQVLLQEKKKTAYSGKYGKVKTNQLNLDLVWDVKINDSSRLLASAYLRGSRASRDTALLKNYFSLGIGLYFLGKKSKFLGGLYIELPDVNNELEKAKPANQVNIRPPLKKLTFGISTKFSFSSILSMANRPRKPDPAN
jgi:hypothetical protein